MDLNIGLMKGLVFIKQLIALMKPLTCFRISLGGNTFNLDFTNYTNTWK